MSFDQLSVQDQQLIDMVIFIDEVKSRDGEIPHRRKGGCFPAKLSDRVDFLRETYAADLISEQPRHLTWKGSREQFVYRITRLVNQIQERPFRSVIGAEDNWYRDLVNELGNLPYSDTRGRSL